VPTSGRRRAQGTHSSRYRARVVLPAAEGPPPPPTLDFAQPLRKGRADSPAGPTCSRRVRCSSSAAVAAAGRRPASFSGQMSVPLAKMECRRLLLLLRQRRRRQRQNCTRIMPHAFRARVCRSFVWICLYVGGGGGGGDGSNFSCQSCPERAPLIRPLWARAGGRPARNSAPASSGLPSAPRAQTRAGPQPPGKAGRGANLRWGVIPMTPSNNICKTTFELIESNLLLRLLYFGLGLRRRRRAGLPLARYRPSGERASRHGSLACWGPAAMLADTTSIAGCR
jgi:hypothetical protein